MLNYILIHPAQCGGWAWKFVAEHLYRAGHHVWSPLVSPIVFLNNPEWHYKEIQTNHCGPIVDPELVSETLIEIP